MPSCHQRGRLFAIASANALTSRGPFARQGERPLPVAQRAKLASHRFNRGEAASLPAAAWSEARANPCLQAGPATEATESTPPRTNPAHSARPPHDSQLFRNPLRHNRQPRPRPRAHTAGVRAGTALPPYCSRTRVCGLARAHVGLERFIQPLRWSSCVSLSHKVPRVGGGHTGSHRAWVCATDCRGSAPGAFPSVRKGAVSGRWPTIACHPGSTSSSCRKAWARTPARHEFLARGTREARCARLFPRGIRPALVARSAQDHHPRAEGEEEPNQTTTREPRGMSHWCTVVTASPLAKKQSPRRITGA